MVTTIEELKQARQRKGWTLPQLAEQIHVSAPAVGSWERGNRKPSIDQVEQWAAVFGLRLALVPATDDVDYSHIYDLLILLESLVGLQPTMAELIEGIRIGRDRAQASLLDSPPAHSEAVFA
jgi:transcriptional regulator with XRE-family HTH domain